MDKFPSIPHLSFSPQINDDDIICDESNQSIFIGSNVIIHEKMDGGNCCIFGGNVFARTHKHPAKHEWFNTIKILIKSQPLFYEKPYFDELMIFGENMTAIHSIKYDKLSSYLYIFAVYNIKTKIWYSINDVMEISKKLSLPNPPLLFNGTFNSINDIKKWMDREIKKPSILGSKDREGFVIRYAKQIEHDQFDKYYAKYVRKGHIQTDKNWTKTWKKVKLIDVNINNNKRKAKKVKKGSVTLKTSFIVCVGLPGSGKSTFAKHLCDNRSEWNRAGTDLFKSQQQKQQQQGHNKPKFKRNKDAVFDFISRKIKDREKVIVENCNVSRDKRIELLDCAFKPNDAICIHFDIDKNECIKRTKQRQNHETNKLFHSKKGNKIIESFWKQFQIPNKNEGFKQIIIVKNNNDINNLLKRLGVNKPLIIQDQNEEKKQIEENKQSEEKKEIEEKIICKKNKNKKMDDGLYHCVLCKSRFAMNLNKICKKLDLEIDKILNCFIIGSRIYGTAKSKSDWNVVIVYDDDIDDIKNTRKKIENIDAFILDKDKWNKQLFVKYNFKLWLTLFLPFEAIWKYQLKIDWKNKFDKKTFVQCIQFEVEKDCKKINNFYNKNKMERVCKIFVHCLRMIKISKEMIKLMPDNDDDNQSFVGMIKFNEIETSVDMEQKQLKLKQNEQVNDNNNKNNNIWIDFVRKQSNSLKLEVD